MSPPTASALPAPRRFRIALVCLLAAGLLGGAASLRARHCSRGAPTQQRRAFYYWKTQWSPSPAIDQALAEHRISRLYVRFFDIDWDEATRAAQPVSPLGLTAPLPPSIEIVPVVFITNRVFQTRSEGETKPEADPGALADRVLAKILRMAGADRITVRELQLDCDWTDGTRARYFHFLERLRAALHARGIRLSSTIRLHQIKYAARTGVPPVDRGMLMLYNFGPLRADAPRSSIFNTEDAERYTAHIASYALPLDLALPLFSWTLHCRDGNVIGLLEKLDAGDIEAAGDFRRLGPGRFEAVRSRFFRGRYVMEGDELRMEETTPALAREAARVAARAAASRWRDATIALFDLDERNLRRHAPSDIETIFAALQ